MMITDFEKDFWDADMVIISKYNNKVSSYFAWISCLLKAVESELCIYWWNSSWEVVYS